MSKEAKEGTYGSTNKHFRKAFTPFTTKLASLLIDLKQREEPILGLFKDSPEWERYESEEYKNIITKQSIQLGGGSRNESEPDPFEMETMCENVEEAKREEYINRIME